jgi:hypothetical protein
MRLGNEVQEVRTVLKIGWLDRQAHAIWPGVQKTAGQCLAPPSGQ